MPGYVDITMQTNQQYIALGHNTAPQMVSVITYLKYFLEVFWWIATVKVSENLHFLGLADIILVIFNWTTVNSLYCLQ